MFGLASRTPHVRIETRARNAVTMLWPDADHTRVRKGSIAPDADAMMFGPHTAKLLRAAVGTGIDARASRDAGSYLCNYLSWRAIEAASADDGPRLAAFVHVPPLARDGASQRKGAGHRITLEELVDAGEAMLLEMVRLTRQARELARAKRACHPDQHRLGTMPARLCHPTYGETALTLPPTIARSCPRLRHAPPHFCVTSMLRKRAKRLPPEDAIMDVNRRHLIGASAAGMAGALAMPPDAARAAPLTSALGRDATQYGVRPGSPDDQTRALQRAIDEAARAQVPLALPPGIYRTGLLRLQNGTQLIGVRGATKLIFTGGASMLSGRRRQQHRPCQHHARRRRHPAADAARPGALPRRTRHPHHRLRDNRQRRQRHLVRERFRRHQRQHHHQHRRHRHRLVRRAGPAGFAQHHCRHQRQRHRNPAHRDRRRRHAGARQPHRGHQGRPRRLRAIRQRHQRVSRRQRDRARQPHPQLRLFGGARQFGVQHPDHRATASATSARWRCIRNSRSRAR